MEINKLIIAGVLAAMALITVFVFVLPEYQKTVDLQDALLQKQAEYNGKATYYQKVSELVATIEGNSDPLQKINSALPSNISLAPLVYFFQQKAAQAGLIVKVVTFSNITAPVQSRSFRNIGFTINLSGSYQASKNFIAALDNSSRLFEIKTISLSSSGFSSSGVQNQDYNLNMDVETHTY